MIFVSQQRRIVFMMTIKPLIRDNIALNAHPEGCFQNIKNQIKEVQNLPNITEKSLNVLIIGGSSGYGLATRIALTFNAHAYTYNVSFERGPKGRSTGSAGYYNNTAFATLAQENGYASDDLNADAFSHETKQKVIADFVEAGRKIDLVVYSVASGIRIHPDTQEKFVSTLKPIGTPFEGYSIDIAKETLFQESLQPATSEEIENTRVVMGGDDYELWIDALLEANLLNDHAKVVTYTYVGSEVTYPIYKDGTIGNAKRDLERANAAINKKLQPIHGEAIISASKTVVTKASVFIPTVALYASALFKVMKTKQTHESITMHKYRLYKDMIYGNQAIVDADGLYRLDAYELDAATQLDVQAILNDVTAENFKSITDFEQFKHDFLALNGFDLSDVDYQK